MNVWFLAPFAIRLFDPRATRIFGGTEVRALTFARGLAATGRHDVHVLVMSDEARASERYDDLAVHFEPPFEGGPTVHRLARLPPALRAARRGLERGGEVPSARTLTRAGADLVERLRLPPPSRTLRGRSDIDVALAFGTHSVAASWLAAARDAGARTAVFLTHDWDIGAPSSAERRRTRDVCYRVADVVVAQTETQLEVLRSFGVPRTAVIKNPVPCARLEGTVEPEAQRYVFWVGRRDTDHKRPALLFELARRLPSVRFVAVMNELPSGAPPARVGEPPPNVEVIERVSLDESERLFRHATAFVSTAAYEGFPNAFLQAARHGVPVWSLAVDPDGVLAAHGFGHCCEGDLDALARGVEQMWARGESWRAMREAGPRYVARHHSLEEQVGRLEQLLEELRPPSSPSTDHAPPRAAVPLAFQRQARGDRASPGRTHHAYWHLTLLQREMERVAREHVEGRGYRVLLDFGCGPRPYEPVFRRHVERYVGADLPGNPAADLVLDADGRIPLDDRSVDVVLSSQVLEHVRAPDRYLDEACRVLSPRGLLVLSTHGVWRYHPDPEDHWRWTSSGLERLLGQRGFDVVERRGLMGAVASGLQLVQDGVRERLRWPLRPIVIGAMQGLIEVSDRAGVGQTGDGDASTYVIVARPRGCNG